MGKNLEEWSEQPRTIYVAYYEGDGRTSEGLMYKVVGDNIKAGYKSTENGLDVENVAKQIKIWREKGYRVVYDEWSGDATFRIPDEIKSKLLKLVETN